MILIADSGSTNVDWRIVSENEVQQVISPGINPVYQSVDLISSIVKDAVGKYSGQIRQVFFYGAGIISEEQSSIVGNVLESFFSDARISVSSDLKGAAVALFGDDSGIVAILGTGSNSGIYDGCDIVSNVRAGGFILGDEGSGANIGKRLLSDYIKGMIPEELSLKLEKEYSLSYPSIVENVYRGAMPSRYLAQFTYFVKKNQGSPYIDQLLEEAFSDFYLRNIMQYEGYEQLQVGLIGSVALNFKEVLYSRAAQYGIRISRIEQSAADGLAAYFRSKL